MDFSTVGLSAGFIPEMSRLIGYCHDFGKATRFFQEYLAEEDEIKKNRLKNREETHHSLISSLFTFHCLNNQCKDMDPFTTHIISLIGYLAVKRHHGDLGDLSDEILSVTDQRSNGKQKDLLKKQLSVIDQVSVFRAYDGLIPGTIIEEFFTSVDVVIEKMKKARSDYRINISKNDDATFTLLASYVYSLLISTDKEEASGLSVDRRAGEIPADAVDRYRVLKGFTDNSTTIGRIRNEIYQKVIRQVDDLDLDQHIYSLNVPTGTGKTLTGLSFALKLRERIKVERGYVPRIIYSLPYISIIDQNADVFNEVLTVATGKKPTSELLLAHHHLSDLFYHTDNEEFRSDESKFLMEGWNSEVIVTTFVQFFHTLISNRNRALRKYHRIANSIVILDEVQAIPEKYWHLFNQILDVLARCFSTYIVLMTATQPYIFEPDRQIKELVPDRKKFYQAFDRYTITLALTPCTLDAFIEKVSDVIRTDPEKDILIVLNTVSSAQNVYRKLVKMKRAEDQYFSLTTRVIPKERLEKIVAIKEKSPHRKVIVSTQMIEAGVDIDVDIVYRDFSPLDSINQVAGRCNRNFGETRGEVRVVLLVDDRGHPLHSFVYKEERLLIGATETILAGKETISEPELFSLIDKYYHRIRDTISNDSSTTILDDFRKLCFSRIGEFSLITEDYPKYDVFVTVDSTAEEIWDRYQSALEIQDRFERKRLLLDLKKNIALYTISVPRKFKNQVGFNEERGIGYLSQKEVGEGRAYDIDLGFVGISDGGTMIF